MTLWGADMDVWCRVRGGWPEDAIAHTIEAIGEGENAHTIISGNIPTGLRKSGKPHFKGAPRRAYQAIFTIAEYRAFFAAKQATP